MTWEHGSGIKLKKINALLIERSRIHATACYNKNHENSQSMDVSVFDPGRCDRLSAFG
jgi:hypothetical protein